MGILVDSPEPRRPALSEWEKREQERQMRKRKVLVESVAPTYAGLEPNAIRAAQSAFPEESLCAIQVGTPRPDEWVTNGLGVRTVKLWACDFIIVPASTLAAGVTPDV